MLNFITAALCLGGIALCICRLGTKMTADTTKTVIRVQYVMWLGVDAFILLDLPATEIHLITSAAIFAYLAMGIPAWRHGAPIHTWKSRDPNF